jgi:hypothetical protein
MATRYPKLGKIKKEGIMNEFFDEAWRRLEVRLEDSEQEPDLLRRYQAKIISLKEVLADLRAVVRTNPFPGKTEEAHYFRHQVPQIYSHLFFLQKLADLERYRSYVAPQKFRDRLERELAEIEQFYNRHTDLGQAHPLSDSPWEGGMFVRQETSDWSGLEVGVFIDSEFTIGSYIAALMQANKSLVSWLLEELDEPGMHGPNRRVVKLCWTANLVDLVELVNGLHGMKCFNAGKATLKDTVGWFEEHLGVKLGNHHTTFQDIARRKISPTKFTDGMKEVLQAKIDAM